MRKINVSNYIGNKYGLLTVIGESSANRKKTCFLLKCECGSICEYDVYRVVSGHTRSCGCYRNKISGDRLRKHGLIAHPLYRQWRCIIQRCYDKNDPNYKNYGAKGVVVCPEWRFDFMPFFNWAIENGWVEGLQIDKDKKGDGKLYSPHTCALLTGKENANYKSTNKVYYINNERFTLVQLSERYGINRRTISFRLKNGWSLDEAINIAPKNTGVARGKKELVNYVFSNIN